MHSLRDKAPEGVLCTFSTRTLATAAGFAKAEGSQYRGQLQTGASGTVRQEGRHGVMDRPSSTNHTLLGQSPPASQAGRRVGPAL
jgi:hypothetical protein